MSRLFSSVTRIGPFDHHREEESTEMISRQRMQQQSPSSLDSHSISSSAAPPPFIPSPPVSSSSNAGVNVNSNNTNTTFRNAGLCCLALQNVTSVLLLHYVESRSNSSQNGNRRGDHPPTPHFSTAIANLCTEIVKLIVSITGLMFFWREEHEGIFFGNNNNNTNGNTNDHANDDDGGDSNDDGETLRAARKTNGNNTAPSRFQVGFARVARAVTDRDSYKMIFIAAIYAIENNLYYVALRSVPPTVFQVVYQLKLVVTALMLRLLLGRRLSWGRWAMLLVVFGGIVLTEQSHHSNNINNITALPTSTSVAPSSSSSSLPKPSMKRNHNKNIFAKHRGGEMIATTTSAVNHDDDDDDANSADSVFTMGLLAVLGCAFCSAFASSYFEAVIKTSINNKFSSSLFVRNTQLAVFSIVSNLILYAISIYREVSANPPSSNSSPASGASTGIAGAKNAGGQQSFAAPPSFISTFFTTNPLAGFDRWVWVVVCVQALGGLLVSVVLKWGDAIIKALATGVAILLNGTVSAMFFGFHPSVSYLIGASVVVIGVMGYAKLN